MKTEKSNLRKNDFNENSRLGYRDRLEIQGLTREFTRKKAFSCSWKEDINSTTSVYEASARKLQVCEENILQSILIMPSDDALI